MLLEFAMGNALYRMVKENYYKMVWFKLITCAWISHFLIRCNYMNVKRCDIVLQISNPVTYFCFLVWVISTTLSSHWLILSLSVSNLRMNPFKAFFIFCYCFLFLAFSCYSFFSIHLCWNYLFDFTYSLPFPLELLMYWLWLF